MNATTNNFIPISKMNSSTLPVRWLLLLLAGGLLLSSCGGDDPSGPDPDPGGELVIDSFSPATARIGDTLTIAGSGFSEVASGNRIYFTGTHDYYENATLTSSSATELSVEVPGYAETGPISVTVKGDSVTSETEFTLDDSPQITGISPTEGRPGQDVEITGSYFGTDGNLVRVFFDNTEAQEVTLESNSRISVTVPELQTYPEEPVPVTVDVDGETSNSVEFTVVEPLPKLANVYFGVTGHPGGIYKAGADGTTSVLYGREVLDADVNGGIAIDQEQGALYYVNNSQDQINKVALDGSSAQPEVLYTSDDGITFDNADIAIDPDNNVMYFTGYADDRIYKANLDGSSSSAEVLYQLSGVYPRTLKRDGSTLYWGSEGGQVMKAPTDGSSTPEVLYEKGGEISQYPISIVINPEGGSIFIAEMNFSDDSKSAILKGSLDGTGGLTTIVSGADGNIHGNINDMEVDPVNGYLYWTNQDNDEDGGLVRTTLNGDNPQEIVQGLVNAYFFEIEYTQ